MATILELARHADVEAEVVLRRLSGEPVSSEVAERVDRAVAELGRPPYPRLNHELEPFLSTDSLPRLRQQLLSTLAEAAEEVGESRDQTMTLLYEALRVEVRPVADQVGRLGSLFDNLAAVLADLRADAQRTQSERIDDLELVVELVTAGWRMVDRRLGRLELILRRIENRLDPNP